MSATETNPRPPGPHDAPTDPRERLARDVVVVLVEPQHPGNVGAAARAMKNMGLERLVLVAPPAYDPEQARWMAPGCDDLLARMRIVATLDEALEGVHRAIASTARHRKGDQKVLDSKAAARDILDTPDDVVTAILFGREDFGLDAASVQRCQHVLRIPTPEHASLNLAQAVLLVAHDLFEEARARGAVATGRIVGGRGRRTTRELHRSNRRDAPADLRRMEPAVQELVGLLDRIGYMRGTNPDKVAVTARAALQNARPSVKHVEALRGMLAKVEWALDHPDADWTSGRKG